jgi:diaminopimelate epimerase
LGKNFTLYSAVQLWFQESCVDRASTLLYCPSRMKMELFRMSAAGNVFYIALDDEGGPRPDLLASHVCHGKGVIATDGGTVLPADGLILGESSPLAQRMFNPDGSEGMCANGLRCLAHLIHQRQELIPGTVINTIDGPKRVWVERDQVRAELGVARPLKNRGEPPEVPFTVDLRGEPITGHGVFVGNPHFVVFADEQMLERVAEVGPLLERDPNFPDGVNVELAARSGDGFKVRVWERGVGETLSCGTGALAVAAAAGIDAGQSLWLQYPGGALQVQKNGAGTLSLSGPVRREGCFFYTGHGEDSAE